VPVASVVAVYATSSAVPSVASGPAQIRSTVTPATPSPGSNRPSPLSSMKIVSPTLAVPV